MVLWENIIFPDDSITQLKALFCKTYLGFLRSYLLRHRQFNIGNFMVCIAVFEWWSRFWKFKWNWTLSIPTCSFFHFFYLTMNLPKVETCCCFKLEFGSSIILWMIMVSINEFGVFPYFFSVLQSAQVTERRRIFLEYLIWNL